MESDSFVIIIWTTSQNIILTHHCLLNKIVSGLICCHNHRRSLHDLAQASERGSKLGLNKPYKLTLCLCGMNSVTVLSYSYSGEVHRHT